MILAATGHRPDKLGGYGDDVFDALTWQATIILSEMKPKSTISGMALGWDQAFAQASANLGIPFLAAVPFVGQESKWPPASQAKYAALIAKAASVHVVSPGGYAAWKMQVRNCWMVDNCDHVLALWDGSAGGTSNCVKYAEKVGRPITNIWTRWAGHDGITI